MIVIEFFDRKNPLNNVVSALVNAPEKVIYIGGSSKQITRKLPGYKAFLGASGIPAPEFEVHGVSEQNLNAVVETLEEIVSRYPDCCIDLTGGNEVCICAAGVIRARHNVQLHRYNLLTGAVYDCDGDGETPCGKIPSITVEQYIRLYGGAVLSANDTVGGSRYAVDIDQLWEISAENPADWNNQLFMLNELRSLNEAEDPLEQSFDMHKVRERLQGRYASFRNGRVLKKLYQAGFLTDYAMDDSRLVFTYRDEAVAGYLEKAGTALELKVWLSAMDAVDDDREALFGDAITGAWLDWDGVEGSELHDTANEVDVILMRGLYPVFISCKNGKTDEEELYKLETVARRFGGENARKALIASDLEERLGGSWPAFSRRAADMGITLLPDAAAWTDEQFAGKLRKILG